MQTLVDILVSKNVIDLAEAGRVREEAREKNISLEELLYQRGVSEPDLADAKSQVTGYPIRSLEGAEVPFDLLRQLPEESARFYQMIPLGSEEGYFDVGMLNPDDTAALEALKFIATRANLPARIFIITPTDFQNVMRQYQSLTGEVTQALKRFAAPKADGGITISGPDGETKLAEDAPVTKMFSVTLRHAVEGKASDIHIEPGREKLRIRFRVDGVLHTSLTLSMDVHAALVTRIKVLTSLKIDETRVPQDGRFHAEISGRPIDFRVSTLPTAFGEKVVIRILDPEAGIAKLEDLGVEGRNAEAIRVAIAKPYGMILITGPTGSGKSTTLYALLQILNQESTNIVSLEDPIEYYIPGVNQSQIRPEINYDFATGLREVVGQGADISRVGGLRDSETEGLESRAALTGHLVLSTLHTNNAIGVVPRLIDMGVDPYLLPPTLILAVGQRLVRRLCEDSRKKVKITGRTREIISSEIEALPEPLASRSRKDIPAEIYQAEISSSCPKGTRGRIGVFETLSMTPELERIILSGPSEAKIQEEARRQGMITMRQDGILKVLAGRIGLEELLESI